MKRFLLFLLLPVSALAQGIFIPARTVTGTVNGFTRPIPAATITVCAANTAGIPCSPALTNTVFKDAGLQVPLSNPFVTDANGNYPQAALGGGVYTITESAAGFAGFSYQATVSCAPGAPCTIAAPFVITNLGTFNNTQQLYNSVAINGFNQKAEFNALFSPSAFALEGISSGVIVPSSSTTNQVNGIAGYAIDQRANPVTPSVGVFGVGNAQALNARVWGANFIGTDIGSASASNSIYGGENDCFIGIVASLCRGLLIEAFWLAGIQPTTVYGIEIGQPLGAVSAPHWTFGMRFDLGATQAVTGSNAAIFFDRSATGNTQRSQGMLFESTNGSGGNPTGFLDMDPSGNLTYVSNVVGTGFQVGAVGINTPSVLFNGFTSGTVTHTAPNTITSYTETDPAAAPAVANAVKQYTTGGVASFSASPGSLTIASGTATMTTAAIGAGACGTTVTVAAAGVATTDTITVAFNAAPAGTNAGLTAWPTSGNVNFAYCPGVAETPAAATVNWRVVR